MQKIPFFGFFLLLLLPAVFTGCVTPATVLPTKSPTSSTELYHVTHWPTVQRTVERLRTATPSGPTVDDFFARCPTADEMLVLQNRIRLFFYDDPTAGAGLACSAANGSADLTPLQKHAYQAILIMEYLTFDAPLPWTGKSLFDWFLGSNIHEIHFRTDVDTSYCCGPGGVMTVKVYKEGVLVKSDLWLNYPPGAVAYIGTGLMDTMVLFVHEARHNEGFGHTCPDGANDRTIAEMGSWGVEYYLYQWLAQHPDRAFLRAPGDDPGLYRRIALRDMVDIQTCRFCDEPTPTPGPFPTLMP